jgi:hypothetical protein
LVYSELRLDVRDEQGRIVGSARNGIEGREGLVPKWSKLAEEETRTVILPSLDGK